MFTTEAKEVKKELTKAIARPPFLKLPPFDNLDDSKEELEKFIGTYGDWIAVITEKIHGASFVAVVCDNAVHYCKRGAYLEEKDEFFGIPEFDKKNQLKLLTLRGM